MATAEPSNDQESDSAVFRAQVRRARIAARLALTADEHARASSVIDAHLDRLLARRPPGIVAFCWPVRKEFDCRPLVTRLLARGWSAAQPVVVAPDAPMVFRPWTPDLPMTVDRHGIPVPVGELAVVPDVVLLPLVAFDDQGYRIGYGGGYFDRTLAALSPRPVTIGIGFELARIDSIRPQPHDVPLDTLVTETGIRDVVIPACIPRAYER